MTRDPKLFRMLVAVTISVLTMMLGAIPSQAASQDSSLESIAIGTLQAEPFPFYIAERNQFFTQNGLNVSVLHFDTETEIMAALENNEIDFAWSSEYAVVNQIFVNPNISVIASIGKSFSAYLIGRKDLGVANIADLKGKRVGLPQQTVLEFYLGRFLELNGMSLRDVTQVNIDPSQSVNAINSGSVDAIVVMLPEVSQIQASLGDRVVMWSAQSDQATFNLLSGRTEWIIQHPIIVEQLLKAMDQANNYLAQYPEQSKAIIQLLGGYDAAYIAEAWPENQFFLSLDQSLIVSMDDEAQWMISNSLTNNNQIPNYLNYIYLNGLTAVKSQAVNIIH